MREKKYEDKKETLNRKLNDSVDQQFIFGIHKSKSIILK